MPIYRSALIAATLVTAATLSAQTPVSAIHLEAPPPQTASPAVPQGPNGAVRISGGVMAEMLVHRVDPIYPADTDAQGAVVLHAIIGPDGTVQQLSVISGPQPLQNAALDAVRQWRYQPYLLNGDPVAVNTTVVVDFRR